jgi:type IV secretory pathway protease TraF
MKKKLKIGIAGLCGIVALSLPSVFFWNRTESIPVGLYMRTFERIEVGSTVSFPAPPVAREYALARGGHGYASQFIKPLAAGPGAEVCVFETETGRWIIIDNKIVLSMHVADRYGNLLPLWMMNDCRRLEEDEWLPIGTHPDSFDGRYFGPIKGEVIQGNYKPFMIFE